MTACETCDQIGPDVLRSEAEWREFHRAAHGLGRAVGAGMIEPLFAWIDRGVSRLGSTRSRR